MRHEVKDVNSAIITELKNEGNLFIFKGYSDDEYEGEVFSWIDSAKYMYRFYHEESGLDFFFDEKINIDLETSSETELSNLLYDLHEYIDLGVEVRYEPESLEDLQKFFKKLLEKQYKVLVLYS